MLSEPLDGCLQGRCGLWFRASLWLLGRELIHHLLSGMCLHLGLIFNFNLFVR